MFNFPTLRRNRWRLYNFQNLRKRPSWWLLCINQWSSLANNEYQLLITHIHYIFLILKQFFWGWPGVTGRRRPMHVSFRNHSARLRHRAAHVDRCHARGSGDVLPFLFIFYHYIVRFKRLHLLKTTSHNSLLLTLLYCFQTFKVHTPLNDATEKLIHVNKTSSMLMVLTVFRVL